MAVNENNLLQKIKGAHVYTGCTLPPSYGGPTLVGGEPAGGTDIGATIGESVYQFNATIETVDIEQTTAQVAPHVTAEAVQMTFTIAEVTADNLKIALSQTHKSEVIVGSDTYDVMHLGGHVDVTGNCVALVAEKANQPSKFYGGYIYNAFVAAETSIPHKRGTVAQVSVTLGGSALLSRSDGDRLGQYFDEQ